MVSRHLFIGISTLALAAGTAHAQNTNTINTSGTGNTQTCNNATTTGNTCVITQTGNNNRATVNQGVSNGAGDPTTTSTRNTAIITQIGDRNSATISQNGNDNYGQLLQGASGAPASDNTSDLIQQGFFNSATVRQTGNFNSSTVRERGGTSGVAASGNIVTVTQNSSQNSATQAATFSSVNVVGNANSVSVTQNGVTQTSLVVAGSNEFGAFQNFPNEFGEATTFSDNGSVTVVQNGSFGYSLVRQVPLDLATRVSNNVANVAMDSENTTGTGFGGSANTSTVEQRSSGNTALVRMTGGGNTGGFGTSNADTQNSSTITQSNSAQASSVLSNNIARAFLGRGSQLSSNITQNGRNNFAEVTLASGVAGTNANITAAMRPAAAGGGSTGNSATVNQTSTGGTAGQGGGSVAIVVTQAARGQTGEGIGNFSTINQNATANYAAPTGSTTTFTAGSETAFFPGSRGQYAVSYQQGQFGNITIGQSDNAESGRTYSNGGVARSRAQVFQVGRLASTTVTQTGDNFADVTQGRIGLDVGSVITLIQTDAGDTSVAGGGFDPQGNPINNFARQSNTATIVQYGDSNVLNLQQNTRAGSATVFQSGGSGNNVDAQQGTGNSSAFVGFDGNTNITAAGATAGTGSSGQRITLNVQNQGGSNNALRVRQDGTDLVATITQVGTGQASGNAGGNTFAGVGATGGQSGVANVIQIAQQGSNNQATARQTSTVGQSTGTTGTPTTASPASGPTGATGAFAGGARSPEIDILQSGTGQRAFAEQRGKGQVARIEQSGTNNTAGILQDTGATNATARITQSGTGNSFFVVQTQPGEFISVTQTGANNTAVTQSGTTGTGSFSGTSAPAGFPTF